MKVEVNKFSEKINVLNTKTNSIKIKPSQKVPSFQEHTFGCIVKYYASLSLGKLLNDFWVSG